MNKKEIQEKLNNLPKPKYLYNRYNGEIKKYEVQDNILINIKNVNDIIDINKQLILGKTSENIIDLIENEDIIEFKDGNNIAIEQVVATNIIGSNNRKLNEVGVHYGDFDITFIEIENIKSILTKEQFENMKFEV